MKKYIQLIPWALLVFLVSAALVLGPKNANADESYTGIVPWTFQSWSVTTPATEATKTTEAKNALYRTCLVEQKQRIAVRICLSAFDQEVDNNAWIFMIGSDRFNIQLKSFTIRRADKFIIPVWLGENYAENEQGFGYIFVIDNATVVNIVNAKFMEFQFEDLDTKDEFAYRVNFNGFDKQFELLKAEIIRGQRDHAIPEEIK